MVIPDGTRTAPLPMMVRWRTYTSQRLIGWGIALATTTLVGGAVIARITGRLESIEGTSALVCISHGQTELAYEVLLPAVAFALTMILKRRASPSA